VDTHSNKPQHPFSPQPFLKSIKETKAYRIKTFIFEHTFLPKRTNNSLPQRQEYKQMKQIITHSFLTLLLALGLLNCAEGITSKETNPAEQHKTEQQNHEAEPTDASDKEKTDNEQPKETHQEPNQPDEPRTEQRNQDKDSNAKCFTYTNSVKKCTGECTTSLFLTNRLYCTKKCSKDSDCKDKTHCGRTGHCLPQCNDIPFDDDARCKRLGWRRCSVILIAGKGRKYHCEP
jgi:hypothetical protein